ncbi:MAG: hypothetical protein CUN53_15565, partial [Phototrophicales bacterium]
VVPDPETRRRSPLIPILALIAVAAAAFVGLIAVGVLEIGERVVPTPTPFSGARTAIGAGYQINVPGSWTFFDRSDEGRPMHVWKDGDRAYVGIAFYREDDPNLTGAASLETAINAYEEAYIRWQPELTFIGQAAAPDGTIRRSYQMDVGDTNTVFQPGQLDIFYRLTGDTLVVIDVFTSWEAADSLVPTMQQIIDSIRIEQG